MFTGLLIKLRKYIRFLESCGFGLRAWQICSEVLESVAEMLIVLTFGDDLVDHYSEMPHVSHYGGSSLIIKKL